MIGPASERRLAENEVIFRRANEQVIDTIKEVREYEKNVKIRAIAKDVALHFYCECADKKCKQRIRLTAKEYKENHTQTNMFMIVPGHEIAEIEKVTKKDPDYYIVQKYMTPPKKVGKLN